MHTCCTYIHMHTEDEDARTCLNLADTSLLQGQGVAEESLRPCDDGAVSGSGGGGCEAEGRGGR